MKAQAFSAYGLGVVEAEITPERIVDEDLSPQEEAARVRSLLAEFDRLDSIPLDGQHTAAAE